MDIWNPVSNLKHVSQNLQWSSSETVNARALKPLPLCSVPWKHTNRVDSGALGKEESHFSAYNMFSQMQWSIWEMLSAIVLSNLCHCVQNSLKNLLVEISGALGTQESHFLSKNVFLRKCCGVSQKWWMLELLKPSPLCSAPLENLLVGISGALGTQESHVRS